MVASLGVAARFQAAESKPSKPNILILYADDLGYADLSATGNKAVRTTHIDSLGRLA
jgi:arylsulfatase A-like enzyme